MQAFLFFIFFSFFVFLTQTVGHTPRCSVETGDENRHDFHCMQMIEAVDARVLKIKYSEKYLSNSLIIHKENSKEINV